MIAQLRANSDARRIESVQDQFLSMLPVIQRQAWIAIRGRDPESRDELTQEVVANAYCAFIGWYAEINRLWLMPRRWPVWNPPSPRRAARRQPTQQTRLAVDLCPPESWFDDRASGSAL